MSKESTMLKRMCESYKPVSPSQAQQTMMDSLGVSSTTSVDAKIAIREGMSNKPIGPIQKMKILQELTYDDLNSILMREVKYLDEITQQDYQKVMQIIHNPLSLPIMSMNHPLKITEEWEYGKQESDKCANGMLYYLLSYDVMMIDVDNKNVDLDYISTVVQELGVTVRVYKTYAGWHIFITSRKVYHRSGLVVNYTSKFKGDIYYRVFSQKFGFKIRLNKKLGREENVAEYVDKYGDCEEIPDILEFLEIHDKLTQHHNTSETEYF